MKRAPSEKQIEQHLVKGILKLGGRAEKLVLRSGGGWMDRTVFLPHNIIVFVELKTETGKLTKLQNAKIAQLQRLGCDVRVLYGLEDVKMFLSECKARLEALLPDPLEEIT